MENGLIYMYMWEIKNFSTIVAIKRFISLLIRMLEYSYGWEWAVVFCATRLLTFPQLVFATGLCIRSGISKNGWEVF